MSFQYFAEKIPAERVREAQEAQERAHRAYVDALTELCEPKSEKPIEQGLALFAAAKKEYAQATINLEEAKGTAHSWGETEMAEALAIEALLDPEEKISVPPIAMIDELEIYEIAHENEMDMTDEGDPLREHHQQILERIKRVKEVVASLAEKREAELAEKPAMPAEQQE